MAYALSRIGIPFVQSAAMTPPAQDPAAELERLRALLAEREAALKAKDAALAAKDAALVSEQERVAKLTAQVESLQRDLDQLARQLFGRKTERVDPAQLKFEFDSAIEEAAEDEPFDKDGPSALLDALASEEEAERAEEAETAANAPSKPRRKRRRDRIPENLEVRRTELHPALEELQCSCGCQKERMGEEVSRKLEVIPARFFWRETVRVKYVCRKCAEITRPSLPPEPIEKGLAGASLLADLLISKYDDHLPLNRLVRIYGREGVELTKSTLGSWVSQAVGLLESIAQQVMEDVLSRPVLQTDETGVLVLDPTAPGGRTKGRMWVYCGQPGELAYRYSPTKEAEWPLAHLARFKGTLVADAYSGFDKLYESGSILEAGCNAHARRYFKKVLDAEPNRQEAKWALLAYQRLFAVEREAKEAGLDADARLALRREKSAPIVKPFYSWLQRLSRQLVPSDPLRKAVNYALNQRKALCRFLDDGRVELDNNRSERSLRQVAVGRGNWLFAGSPDGAECMATALTLIMSCRELGVSSRDYLVDVLDRVSTHPASRVSELTPRAWSTARERATAPVPT